MQTNQQFNLMKKLFFLIGIGIFNLSYSQKPFIGAISNPKSKDYSYSQNGIQRAAKSNNDLRSDLFQYVAWTEPVVIRKDYDLFRIVLHSKISGIASLSWSLKNSYIEESGFYIERDGIKLQEITLYDDGSHGDGKAGDGLISCDRFFLQGEPTYPDIYTFDNIATQINLLPYGNDINVRYTDGHQGIISQSQLLDYSVLNLMLLNPNTPIPNVRQLSDSAYASDYIASIIVPVNTTQILNKTGWPNFPEVGKSFYKYFNDDIDFLFFDFKPLWQIQVLFQHNYSGGGGGLIKNDVEGTDQPIIDYSSYWGSNRLQFIVPSTGGVYNNIWIYNHEILHRWITMLSFDLGITDYGHHWGFVQRKTTGFNFLGAYNGVFDTIYRENSSTFCGDDKGGRSTWYYNDLELYLMGLLGIDSVKFPIITLPKGTPINFQDHCYKVDSLRKISKNEFLSILGNRVPSVNESQKHFRFSDLLISTRKPYNSEIAFYDQSMRLYELPKGPTSTVYGTLGMTFEEATQGRAKMGTKLTPKYVSGANYLPVATKPISRKILTINSPALDINLNSIFIDADGDILKYKAITSDSTISSVNISGNILSIHPLNYGSVTCVVTADDGHGGASEIAFVIEVSSITTGIIDLENSNIWIYPNPAKTILFIKGISNISYFAIFNSLGQLLEKEQIINDQIDITNLDKGIYFVRITEKNMITTRRFVKQ